MRIAGFLKVRNELLREGNLYRVLDQLERFTNCGVICDDASTDGTLDVLEQWVAVRPGYELLRVPPAEQRFENELSVKQRMLEVLHAQAERIEAPDWILWLDGDEEVACSGRELRDWLAGADSHIVCWAFHYTQLWRNESWARTDDGFDDGWFYKLWRYAPDLRFETKDHLHHAQFPMNFWEAINTGRAARAPFEVIHWGNYGKNLVWKVIQYTGTADPRSVPRHRDFEHAAYRSTGRGNAPVPIPFTAEEKMNIERMKNLRAVPDLAIVLIPTYNRGRYIRQTVESVIAQTDQHWVCLVLDDGSTDETPQVMAEVEQRDPRIFYARYEENRGGVAMNEIGMGLACEMGGPGSIWIRLGSDDYFYPHKIELDRLAFKYSDVGVCFGPYRDLHESGEKDIRATPSDARGALLSKGFAASWANIAVRVDMLRVLRERFGAFCDARIRNMEDWLVNVRLATFTTYTWRGRLKDGRTIIGGRSFEEISKALGTQVVPDDLVHDAVWRIGADGASANSDQCAKDAKLTTEILAAELPSRAPTEREAPPPVVLVKDGQAYTCI